MCRLFGQISDSPRTAEDFLADAPRSLLAQSDARADDLQPDGWGVAWFEGPRARLVKSPAPVFEEAQRFRKAASAARSTVVVAHIRAASNPRGLAGGARVDRANTQPFTDGRWVFCHNGTLHIPDEIARRLGRYRRRLESVNDSEVYFWQLRKFIDERGSVAEAFKACVREDRAAWSRRRGRYPGKRSPYTGLNALASDGRGLYALCHYPARRGVRGLMSRQPWGTMSLGLRGGRVVIASEDMDGKGWRRLGPAEVVSVAPKDGRLVVERERFDPTEEQR